MFTPNPSFYNAKERTFNSIGVLLYVPNPSFCAMLKKQCKYCSIEVLLYVHPITKCLCQAKEKNAGTALSRYYSLFTP